MNQNRIFVEGEAECYFRRNAAHNAQYDLGADIVAQTIEAAELAPRSILDLGCSSGERLSALCVLYDAEGLGIDASEEAIGAARHRDPALNWYVQDLASIKALAPYDLVILSYVLHWIDRADLLRTMAVVHGATAMGGHLVINEFSRVDDVPYKHAEGVITRKRDYPAMFTATGLYVPVRQRFYPYPGNSEACACTVLKKVE